MTTDRKTLALTLHGETEIEHAYEMEAYQYVVETSDIEDVAILSDDRYLKISGLPATRESVELINELLADVDDIDEAKEVLEAQGYTVDRALDYEPAASGDYDALIWCREGAFLLSDCEPVPSYTWWDGSNWRREWPEDMTDVVVDAVYEDLDTYSSNGDKRFRRQWEHGKLYTVLTIDDEPITEPTYLLYISSQWQGSRDVARLIDADEREMLLAETSGELYTVAQAAEALDISQQRVRALCADGRCGRKVGRDWVLTAADVESLRGRPGPGRPRSEETDLRNLWSALGGLGTDVLAPHVRETECGDLSPVGLLAEAARKLGQSERVSAGVAAKRPANAICVEAGYVATQRQVRWIWLREPLTAAESDLVARLSRELDAALKE